MTLEEMFQDLKLHGPNRILIKQNDAIPSWRARLQGIIPSIIFFRDDGWSLGAPVYLEKAAYKLYTETWVGFIRREKAAQGIQPIKEYSFEDKI